jgi:hypothetical protein
LREARTAGRVAVYKNDERRRRRAAEPEPGPVPVLALGAVPHGVRAPFFQPEKKWYLPLTFPASPPGLPPGIGGFVVCLDVSLLTKVSGHIVVNNTAFLLHN